jgi:hypothetical protein
MSHPHRGAVAIGLVLLTLRPVAALGAQGPGHVVGAGSSGYGPVTVKVIDQRLRIVAERLQAYAALPRIALCDVAFPKDSAEYAALHGYAVLALTALTQHPAELPLGRLYVRSGARETALVNLTWVRSDETVVDSVVARTLGRDREDALYLLPIALHAQPGALLLDFAVNRSEFLVQRFEGLPDDVTWLPTAAPTAERPAEAALLALVAREYPGFVTR